MTSKVSFKSFLEYARKRAGKKGSDEYWRKEYDNLERKNWHFIEAEMPYLVVGAIGDDNKLESH